VIALAIYIDFDVKFEKTRRPAHPMRVINKEFV